MNIPSASVVVNEYDKWFKHRSDLESHIREWEKELKSVRDYVTALKDRHSYLGATLRRAGELSSATEKMRLVSKECFPSHQFDPSRVSDSSSYHGNEGKIVDYRYYSSHIPGECEVEINIYRDKIYVRSYDTPVKTFSVYDV